MCIIKKNLVLDCDGDGQEKRSGLMYNLWKSFMRLSDMSQKRDGSKTLKRLMQSATDLQHFQETTKIVEEIRRWFQKDV